MVVASNIYLIKDLSRLSGHSVHTLKFYLKLGLIKEVGRSPETRFRYFDDRTLEQLSKIRMWRRQQKSLGEIQQLLNGSGLPGPPLTRAGAGRAPRPAESESRGGQGSGNLPAAPSPEPPALSG